jgi:tRNA wybutosine-synthesizing protein 3
MQTVEIINASDKFFTTSSCSGRIMLIQEAEPTKRKNGAEFIYVSHELVRPEQFDSILMKASTLSGNVFLKLEPLIIHVECESLDLAVRLLHVAKLMGPLKHSCIVSAVNSKFVVAIKGLAKMEVPIIYDGKLLTDLHQFRQYLSIANDRMKENFNAIAFLENELRGGVLDRLSNPECTQTIDYDKARPTLIETSAIDHSLPSFTTHLLSGEMLLKIRQTNISLDQSMRFAVLGDGSRIGIIPDQGNWPAFQTADEVRIFQADAVPFIIFAIRGDLWGLHIGKKSTGELKLKWRLLNLNGKQIECYGKSIDAMYLNVDGKSYHIDWVADEPSSRKVKVTSFQRFGNAIQIDQKISPEDAQIYANNMKVDLVLYSHPQGGTQILYSRDSKTQVRHKENGVIYVIDFSIDTFSPSLVSSRNQILQGIDKSETVLEIANSVNCFSIAISAKSVASKVLVVVENESIRSLISESLTANCVSNYVLARTVEELRSYFPVDRVIVSHPTVDFNESMRKTILRRGGVLNAVPELKKRIK